MPGKSILDTFKNKAKVLKKKIILAEGYDIRHVEAAGMLQKENIMKEVVLIGDEDKVLSLAKEKKISLDNGITIVDPKKSPNKDAYITLLFERRKHKGMTVEKAKEIIENESIYTAAAMVALDEADGMVGGAVYSTAEMIRATLFLIGVKPGLKTLSSFFLMEHPNKELFENGCCIFSDCGVVPNPTAEQLADIATSAVSSYKSFISDNPKVALLSFSTRGSAKDALIDKVIEAKNILDHRNVDFDFDGEMQFDAALLPAIAEKKAPDSKVAGNANIFIFPDLNAGNIGYKIAERLGGCKAIGPILQGALKPVNDLSRGCSSSDIMATAIITALQSQ